MKARYYDVSSYGQKSNRERNDLTFWRLIHFPESYKERLTPLSSVLTEKH